MNTSNRKWRKPMTFGLVAALGCLLAAGLGELWLGATKPPLPPPPPPPPPQPQQVVALVLDTSSSMEGGALEEMKNAAQSYVERQDFKFMRVTVVNFDNNSHVIIPLSRDSGTLTRALDALSTDGLTRMDLGLKQAFSQVKNQTGERNILLFTDGVPEGPFLTDVMTPTLQTARQIRQSGVRLIAIASGGADRDFLAQLTGDSALVFSASQGNFGEAFKQAEQIITPPSKTAQLLESAPTENTDFSSSLFRIAVWTAILGFGLTLPLLLAQKRYMRRRPDLGDAMGAVGGTLIGLLAGTLAQSFFALAAGEDAVATGGRILAWAIWGGALGWGLSAFVPNLRADRAAPAGAVGGILGAIGFLAVANLFGDMTGRLVGAAILGFCIGAMIVLAEVAFRRAWLHVSYGLGDAYDLNLGVRPLGVGSDPAKARVLAQNTLPVAAKYALTETGRVYIEEPESNRRFDVEVGDERRFGNVTIKVCGEMAEVSSIPAAPPLPPQAQHTGSMQYPGIVNGWQLWHPHTPLQIGNNGVWTIGRASDNQLVVGEGTISSHHARLEVHGGALFVIDTGSTNGTFINGARLEPHLAAPLRHNDRLQLGQTEFVILQF